MNPVIPKHVGIIMDGNRRFAENLGEDILKGHEYGADKVEEVLDWCQELGVKALTLWAFSTENFNRSKEELGTLFNLFIKSADKFARDKRVHENKIKLNFIGNLSLFPENVQSALKNASDATKNNDKFLLNIALGYGGRAEVTDAVKKIAQLVKEGKLNPEDITDEIVEANMYSSLVPDVDLVIRTSGEQRTSGFLMWKTNYSEYYFSDKFWPEFDKEDLLKAIIAYNDRQRRFGV